MDKKSTYDVKFNFASDFRCATVDIGGPAVTQDFGKHYKRMNEVRPVPLGIRDISYIPWGEDNLLPFHVMDMVGEDEVISENMRFSVLACYGQGVQYLDRESGKPTANAQIRHFACRNQLKRLWLEACTDMKYFYMAWFLIITDTEHKQVTKIRHKEACFMRFGCDGQDLMGRNVKWAIEHDFSNGEGVLEENTNIYPLLDMQDPIGDLMQRMGKEPRDNGRLKADPASVNKYVMCVAFPMPGDLHYKVPYYSAIFRGSWYGIKRSIAESKMAKMQNGMSVRYLVEFSANYWKQLARQKKLTKQEEVDAMRVEKQREIENFLTGVQNRGKVIFSNYLVTPDGKEDHDIKISLVDGTKDGGEYIEDTAEASNTLCYAMGVHPNLVGSNPGKGGSNNSGSDKRELFTMKQAMETAYHDIMLQPLHLVAEVNGWLEEVEPQVPMILLTTLDEHQDAKEVTNLNTGTDDQAE